MIFFNFPLLPRHMTQIRSRHQEHRRIIAALLVGNSIHIIIIRLQRDYSAMLGETIGEFDPNQLPTQLEISTSCSNRPI